MMWILCIRVEINKRSFELFVFGSCFRTLAVILFQIFVHIPCLLLPYSVQLNTENSDTFSACWVSLAFP